MSGDQFQRRSGFNCQSICDEIYVERERQVKSEGFDETHDDRHAMDDLARAAAFYAAPPWFRNYELWPWTGYCKPASPSDGTDGRRRELIKAAALCVAEIERIDRATARPHAICTQADKEEKGE